VCDDDTFAWQWVPSREPCVMREQADWKP
jgi:hypothetical protein